MWEQVKTILRARLGNEIFEHRFASAQLVATSATKQTITISVATLALKRTIESVYLTELSSAWEETSGWKPTMNITHRSFERFGRPVAPRVRQSILLGVPKPAPAPQSEKEFVLTPTPCDESSLTIQQIAVRRNIKNSGKVTLPDIREIARICYGFRSIELFDMMMHGNALRARLACIYLAKTVYADTIEQRHIERLFNKSHQSINHSVVTARNTILTVPEFRQQVERIYGILTVK